MRKSTYRMNFSAGRRLCPRAARFSGGCGSKTFGARTRARAPRCRSFPGWIFALVAALVLAACEKRPPDLGLPLPDGMTLEKAAFEELPGWRDDTLAKALPALRRSCGKLSGYPDDKALGPNGFAGTAADWQGPCKAIMAVEAGDSAALREALTHHFDPLAVVGEDGAEGLFTGYYEATLEAAETRRGSYRHPLYRPPEDLIRVDLGQFQADLKGRRIVGRVADRRLVPYHTRAEIEAGRLEGRGLELLWADDPVDVFFLHVQGSGVARLPDGATQRVGYAASNGLPFTAIGRELIRRGVLEGQDMSMQAIRDWLRGHPEEADALMRLNDRYIFFRIIDGPGPIGAFGVPLTAGRSLAVDPGFLPLGAPVWLATTYPARDEPLRRLMVAQDTGSAIKGAVRGDFFWGHGESALEQAGRMKQSGRYWLFLPKKVLERAVPSA